MKTIVHYRVYDKVNRNTDETLEWR